MPPLPPTTDVLERLQLAVLPAAGGAALVVCLFLILGRWAGALGSAAAAVVGFAWANYTFTSTSWEGTGRLTPWVPDDPGKPWEWLPRAAAVLVAVGLLSRWVGLLAIRCLPERFGWVANLLVWAPRVVAVAVVAGWPVPVAVAANHRWLVPVLAGVMTVEWVVLDSVARSSRAGGQVAAYQSVTFMGAAGLMLYHHWAGAADLAVILGSVMFGVAVAAGAGKADASGAVPAGVGVLPGLVLIGPFVQDSRVPSAAFWLVGLAPLALAPFVIPRLARQNGPAARAARAVLVLIPVAVALYLATQHEQLAFSEW